MKFIDMLADFYGWYENDFEEVLSQDEKVAIEEFAMWLDRYTDSEAKE